jgi:hypothetical protein
MSYPDLARHGSSVASKYGCLTNRQGNIGNHLVPQKWGFRDGGTAVYEYVKHALGNRRIDHHRACVSRADSLSAARIESMKFPILILAALTVAVVSTTAMAEDAAQMQIEQQACENDVYTLCNDAVPDRDRITACLKRHWSKISRECRTVMRNHGRRHRGD